MELKNMSREEIEMMSYTDLTYIILKDNKKPMNTADLFKKICELLDFGEDEFNAKIGDYYTSLTIDKRFYMLDYDKVCCPIIITSNLPKLNNNFLCVNYNKLIDKNFVQPDNAGIMLMRLLCELGIKKITLAGFDGFSRNSSNNYFSSSISSGLSHEALNIKNEDIKNQINKLKDKISIKFLTPSLYNKREKNEKI